MSSITHVVDGENEEILNRYEYDAWGNLTTCEEKVQNRFKFNGQQYDPVSQQYYLRARYYNPVIGRFTQEDSYNVDGLNLYAYCRNNPVYYVDPSGNICGRRANTLMDNVLSGGQLTRKEKRQLTAKLRDEARNGTISDKGRDVARQMGIDIDSISPDSFKPNRGRQNATEDEINLARNEVLDRISQMKDNMNGGEKGRTTYGAAVIKKPDGNTEMWVSAAGKKGYVRPGIRGDDTQIRNKLESGNTDNRFNDAEQTLMREANIQNVEILVLGATRPVCPQCQEAARNNQIIDRVVTELK